jgi:hypothetical protein
MAMKFVNIHGQRVSTSSVQQVKSTSAGLKRVFDKQSAKQSLGFEVCGYPPAQWQRREDEYRRLLANYQADPDGAKHPGTEDEFTYRWVNKNRPKKARSKPYEIASAAEQCADLCRRSGWQQVRIEEVLKG